MCPTARIKPHCGSWRSPDHLDLLECVRFTIRNCVDTFCAAAHHELVPSFSYSEVVSLTLINIHHYSRFECSHPKLSLAALIASESPPYLKVTALITATLIVMPETSIFSSCSQTPPPAVDITRSSSHAVGDDTDDGDTEKKHAEAQTVVHPDLGSRNLLVSKN